MCVNVEWGFYVSYFFIICNDGVLFFCNFYCLRRGNFVWISSKNAFVYTSKPLNVMRVSGIDPHFYCAEVQVVFQYHNNTHNYS